MTNTIETRLADAQKLLNLAVSAWNRGEKGYAIPELKAACAQLLVITKDIQAQADEPADEALTYCCGHCGHVCNVNELQSGACPRCGALKDGVLVVARVEERQPKPRGHCVIVDGWRV